MNEIIERMARVIDPLAFTSWSTPPRGLETAPRHIVDGERLRRQRKAERTARAAFLAAREPTEAMCKAACNAGIHLNITPAGWAKAYQAMFDEALSEGSELSVNDGATS